MQKVLRKLLYATAVAAIITAGCAAGITAGVLDGFQRRASDSLFPAAPTDDKVVVVAIDRKTIDYLGKVTPLRSDQALLARQLTAAGAAVVVWDVVFSDAHEEEDPEFVAALEQVPAPIIGVSYQSLHPKQDDEILDVEVDLGPRDYFANAGNTTLGHVNVTNDPTDGVVRSLPLVFDDGRNLIPALSLAALRAYLGQSGPLTRVTDDGVQVGNRFIPTGRRHSFRVNFASGLEEVDKERAIISAADVLTGSADPNDFKGKIVLIGATETLAGDTLLAPVDKSNTFPGVLIHANALNTMLTRAYLEPVSDAENTLIAGLLALVVTLAVLFLPVWLSLIGVLLLTGLPPLFPGAFLLVAFERFDSGDIMNIVYPLGAIVVAFVGGLAVRYLTETRQRRRVSSLFAQYVPEEVARQLEESGALDSHVEGERVDVGLFFCDLRGFTSLSATLEPQDVRAMLNKFYDLLTEIIHSHHGTVLKFVGDEVFAVFGAPLPCQNNAQATLDCAIEIQTRAHELDTELASLKIPPVKFGIGMNAGAVVAAHIGGGRRRQYDIVGDTVNLGSRLCSQAGKGEIVLPESMIERLTDVPEMESMGAVQLKGLEEPVPLFKVVVGESEPRQPAAAPAATTSS